MQGSIFDLKGNLLSSGSWGFWGSVNGVALITETFYGGRNYGFMNSQGIVVVPTEYDYMTEFSGNLCTAFKDGQWYVLEIVQK